MYDMKGLVLDQDRALCALQGCTVEDCMFDGPQGGCDALLCGRELTVKHCTFHLPSPLWHLSDGIISDCTFHKGAVSALCYATRVVLSSCQIEGDRALVGGDHIVLDACTIHSHDMGWDSHQVILQNAVVSGNNSLSHASHIHLTDVELTGDYALFHVAEGEIDFSTIHAEGALWHSKNLTISDTVLEGDRPGWYSENLTLSHCVISGKAPFCHCKNLTLIDCVLDPSCENAFEGSEVHATIRGSVTSVRAPLSGSIEADGFATLIDIPDTFSILTR